MVALGLSGPDNASASCGYAVEAIAQDRGKVDLRPRFVVGQENRFTVEMKSRTGTQLLDRSRVRLQEYNQRILVKRRVVSLDEGGGATMEVVYQGVLVTLIAGNKAVTFDTEGTNGTEAEELLGVTARNAINKPFTVKVDALGQVLSVSGNTNEGDKPAAVNLIGSDIIGQSMAPIFGLGSEPEGCTASETWTITRSAPAGKTGKFQLTTTNTLSAVAEPQATIDIRGTVALEPSDMARRGKAEMTASQIVGQQVWNARDGVADRSVYRQEMTIEADVEIKDPLTGKSEVKRRQAETMLYIEIERIDQGVGGVPPLLPVADHLRPREAEVPAEPGSPAAQPEPGAAPSPTAVPAPALKPQP